MKSEEDSVIWGSAGPVGLICSFAIASTLPLASLFDLFFVGVAGFVLSSLRYMRGFFCGLLLLIIVGIVSHCFLEKHHFFRLGLEASFLCSFLVTAICSENARRILRILKSQIVSKTVVIQNLEEEFLRDRESFLSIQIASGEKLENLQRNFEELQAEKSSLEVLNDVLRKSNAEYFYGMENFSIQAAEDKRRVTIALSELQEAQQLSNNRHVESMEREKIVLHKQVNEAQKIFCNLTKIDSLCRQLEEDLQAESELLNKLSKVLFQVETKLQAETIEKENEAKVISVTSNELDRVNEKVLLIEKENKKLEDIVNHLTITLTDTKPLTTHRIPLPTNKSFSEKSFRDSLLPKKKKGVKN